jgi:hypothetical protein
MGNEGEIQLSVTIYDVTSLPLTGALIVAELRAMQQEMSDMQRTIMTRLEAT